MPTIHNYESTDLRMVPEKNQFNTYSNAGVYESHFEEYFFKFLVFTE